MTQSEAVILLLNHSCDLAGIPQEAWPHVAHLFQPGDGNAEYEASIEATIAAIIHEPLAQLSNGDLEDK